MTHITYEQSTLWFTRLLTTDNPLFLPVETNIRLLIASSDVYIRLVFLL